MTKEKIHDGEIVEPPKADSSSQELAVVSAEIKQVSPAQLQKLVEIETKKRAILRGFIDKNLSEGDDYGKIHIAKDCPNKYKCENEYHFSKKTLFKSGSEKFTSLFQLRPIFEQDKDTWEMAGSQSGTFFYVCKLTDKYGNTIAEGRGACSIQEKGSANTAIKIAQKRAQTDAILRQGAISDFFTQDLDDLPPDERQASSKAFTPTTTLKPAVGANRGQKTTTSATPVAAKPVAWPEATGIAGEKQCKKCGWYFVGTYDLDRDCYFNQPHKVTTKVISNPDPDAPPFID